MRYIVLLLEICDASNFFFQNIVIDYKYRAKIIDFGSASAIATKPGNYFTKFNGTTHFASPEIVKGFPYKGPEAEIWCVFCSYLKMMLLQEFLKRY
jgi:serine/threonine protein kinase